MMLQVGDDGVVTSVNEEELVYVDKNELEQLIENYQQLEKENEQLKNHIQELQNHLKRLENENEQIKQVIKEAYETERTDLGKSVLKQLLNNIGEI